MTFFGSKSIKKWAAKLRSVGVVNDLCYPERLLQNLMKTFRL